MFPTALNLDLNINQKPTKCLKCGLRTPDICTECIIINRMNNEEKGLE